MHELSRIHGCEAKWIVFLDADIVVLDLTRTLESIILFSNQMYFNPEAMVKGEGCDIIAQLSSTTINSGVIFVHISPESELFMRQWMKNIIQYRMQGLQWQDEQGWLQHTYLEHLEQLYDVKMPFNCAGTDIQRLHRIENSIRSQCFATVMYSVGLLPVPGKKHILYRPHLLTAFLEDTHGQTTTTTVTTVTQKHRRQRKSSGVCIMAGLTTEDRFNFHDTSSNRPLLHCIMHPPPRNMHLHRSDDVRGGGNQGVRPELALGSERQDGDWIVSSGRVAALSRQGRRRGALPQTALAFLPRESELAVEAGQCEQ